MTAASGFVPPETVYGIDFGVGATDAGRSTWLVELDASGDTPHVVACDPLADRLDCSPARDTALPALTDFVGSLGDAAVGFDFPFGLPAPLLPDRVSDWRAFLAWFARETSDPDGSFPDPDGLSDWGTARARESTDGERAYLPRETDQATSAQCAYGFIGKYPTYYGLRDLLVPLVHDPPAPRVTVTPAMDHGRADGGASERPLLLETYPAAIHETRAVYRESYKESTAEARDRRVANRDALLGDVDATTDDRVCERIADDTDGDALDALAAAVAAYANTRDADGLSPTDVTERERIEARIYR